MENNIWRYFWVSLAFGTVLGSTIYNARATDCPPDVKTCKVIVLSPEQISALKLLIENTAVSGPYAQVKEAVKFYTDMLDKAPDGVPVTKEEPKK